MIAHVPWWNILTAAAVLFVVVGAWFAIYYLLVPHIDNPDGKARITGHCGDTMEISLSFKGERAVDTSYWTNGCTHSRNCISAAASLAVEKTPDEILEINSDLIQRSIGGLPKDHMHCAALAAETLQKALDDYMLKQKTRAGCSGCRLVCNNKTSWET